MSSTTRCAMCNTDGAHLCQRCKSIAYCSKPCQTEDWPCHKLICAQLADAAGKPALAIEQSASDAADTDKDPNDATEDPSKQLQIRAPAPAPASGSRTVRGILFDPDSKHPQLISVRCPIFRDEESGVGFQDADVTPWLGSSSSSSSEPERLFAEHNRVRGGRQMQSFVEVWYRPDAPADLRAHPDLRLNRGVLAATRGKCVRAWEGPVVVLAMSAASGGIVDPGFYRDVSGWDFRDAVDFISVATGKR